MLINNAGVLLDRGQMLRRIKMSLVTESFATNTIAPLRVLQTLMPLLVKAPAPRVVNLSSIMGQMASMNAGTPAYRISKAALNAVTAVFAAEMQGTPIKINAMHPGWVATEMGGSNAPKTTQEGADTAVWLATLPANGPTGKFFHECREIAW